MFFKMFSFKCYQNPRFFNGVSCFLTHPIHSGMLTGPVSELCVDPPALAVVSLILGPVNGWTLGGSSQPLILSPLSRVVPLCQMA